MNQYDRRRSRNGSFAFAQNGGTPPCFPFEILGNGIENELCDWLILLLALMVPINQFTLDRKRRIQAESEEKENVLILGIPIPSSLRSRFRLRFFIHSGTDGFLRFRFRCQCEPAFNQREIHNQTTSYTAAKALFSIMNHYIKKDNEYVLSTGTVKSLNALTN